MSTNPHQPDTHPNGVVTTATSDPPHPPGFLHPSTTTTTTTTTSSKRQRRPSIRLGDIGEQPASAIPHESYIRRCKQLNLPIPPQYLLNHTKPVPSTSKAPPRTPSVRRRLNSNFEAPREDRGFERESDSYAAGYEDDADDEVGDAPSETDGGNWSVVGKWLEGLGLGKYRPVFEIHEVDGEVLALLTLDDLKEMGISAVGSRRKMYSAIQSLRNNINNNNSNNNGNKAPKTSR